MQASCVNWYMNYYCPELKPNKNKNIFWQIIKFKLVRTPLHCKEVLLVDWLLSSTLNSLGHIHELSVSDDQTCSDRYEMVFA